MTKDPTLETILENKKLAPSSMKLYNANFMKLNDGKPVLTFKFLIDIPTIIDKIKDYKPNTQRNYLIAITSLMGDLSKNNPKKYARAYKDYSALLDKYNTELKDQTAKTDTEKDNWLTPEKKAEVISSCEAILPEVAKKRKITENQYNRLLECVVLSLYTKVPPRRNQDYQFMRVVSSYNPELPNETNYLDLQNKKFIFNKYKTQGAYKQQVQEIPEDLFDILKLYLKLKPKNSTNDFITDYEGSPFIQINSITRILNKIFDAKVGASMLRKLYLSDKYSKVMEDLKADTSAMGTSVDTAKNNYIKDTA
jgi:hypothetical protein